MTELERRMGFPWKWFVIGLLIELAFIPFFMSYTTEHWSASPYSRNMWNENFINDDGFLLPILMIGGGALQSLIGARRISPANLSILYTFFHVAFATQWFPWCKAQWMEFGLHNRYEEFAPFLSGLVLPPEQAAIARAGLGGFDFGMLLPILAFWTIFPIANIFMYYFLAALFRHQLIDVEKLPFPWTVPAIEMIKTVGETPAGTGAPLSREVGEKKVLGLEKLLWYGFAVGWLIYIWDILRLVSGGIIPRIPIQNMGMGVTDYTAVVGGAFGINFDLINSLFILIAFPMDIIFTLIVWYGFWYTLFPMIVENTGLLPAATYRGWGQTQVHVTRRWDWPKLLYVTDGILVAIALYTIFQNRGTFSRILKAFQGRKELDDPTLSLRIPTIGYILSFVVLIGMFLAVGSSPILLLPMMIWNQVISVGLLRLRSEWWWMGNGMWGSGAEHPITLMELGGDYVGQPSTFTTYFLAGNISLGVQARTYGGHYSLQGIDAFKVSYDTGQSSKITMLALIIATLVGFPVAQGIMTYWYSTGYITRHNGTWWSAIMHYTTGSLETPVANPWAPTQPYLTGIVVGLILIFMRARFAWFPLNPVAMAGSIPFMFPTGPWVFCGLIPIYIIKYVAFRTGGDRLMGRITRFGIGLLAAYFLKEMLFFGLAHVIGLANIPPAT